MKVRDVMTSPVVAVRPDATFAEMVDRMLAHDISGLPVIDAGGALLGIVTEADIVAKGAYGHRRRRGLAVLSDVVFARDTAWIRKAAGLVAADVMTPTPVTVGPAEDVSAAARRMLEARVKRLPVVEDGRVIGMISRRDVLRQFDRTDAEIEADVRALLADVMRVPEDAAVRAEVAGGVVTLRGSARHPSDASVIESAVGRTPGVVRVVCEVGAREPEPKVR